MASLLIDADILAYQASSMVEVTIKWDDDIFTLHSDLAEAKKHFDSMVESLHLASGAEGYVLCFTDRRHVNFRKTLVDPTYKANRKDMRRPLVLTDLEKYAYTNHPCAFNDTLEADDVIGIWATSRKNMIIYSEDKDLNQIPGIHFDGKELYTVTPEQGYRFFMSQVITGDTVDGYKGCPGAGPVKAEKLLSSRAPHDYWLAIVDLYDKAGLTEEDALTQARLARILTSELYINGEVKLWSPTE
jgi:DNA polymerase-1